MDSSDIIFYNMTKEILRMKNVNNYYKKTQILTNCSFGIPEGSFHAFIGENGAGKTTMMNLIIGALNDYDGNIFFNGEDIRTQENKSILFIPERLIFPSHLNSYEYVKVFSELFKDKGISKKEILDLFDFFGINDCIKTKANKLSSGQKKKVSLIRAILSEPKLLLIDEPAANLDPTSRIKLFEELSKMNKNGTTVFISSHIISELEKYVDSGTMIKKGKIVWNGILKKNELSNKYFKIVIQGGEDV